jgi:hypothetical protein
MGTAMDQLLEGMDVFDFEGRKVGKVIRYDKQLGYFETMGTFSGPRYIPFFAIERIGPSGLYLNVTKFVVSDIYSHMPAVRPDFTPGGKPTGSGTVVSGHTAQTVPLDAEALLQVRDEIQLGTTVLDADNKNLGTVEDYDSASGYMRIEKDGFTIKDIYLPATSVSFLDDQGIHLSEEKEAIMSRFSRVPEVAREYFER